MVQGQSIGGRAYLQDCRREERGLAAEIMVERASDFRESCSSPLLIVAQARPALRRGRRLGGTMSRYAPYAEAQLASLSRDRGRGMTLLSSPQGTPERVWSLVAGLAALGGTSSRADLRPTPLNPGFERDGAEVKAKATLASDAS